MITINKSIAYNIENYPNYVVVKGGEIYNIKTNRKVKKTLNGGYTKGVWFGKKFVTEHQLEKLLIKPKKEYCPF